MSSGAKVVAAFIRETTPGITPTAGAWNLLRRSSFGLKPTQNTNDNDEIAGDRMAQGVSRGTVDVGGDVGEKRVNRLRACELNRDGRAGLAV